VPTTLTARLPTELRADAAKLARLRGQSLSELVRDALEREILTDLEDWQHAIRARLHEHRDEREHWRSGARARLEANASPPNVVAAVRSAAIRRRQKRRKR
jgi:predicted DNA-binding protein